MKALHTRSPLVCLAMLMLATLAAAAPPAHAAAEGGGRYIVELHDYGTKARQAVLNRGHVHLEFPESRRVAATLSEEALAALRRDPSVKSIEVDPPRFPLQVSPGDVSPPQVTPWGITAVQANQIKDNSSANRIVCIIDSGYHRDHEDLPDGPNVTGSTDPGTGDPFVDQCSHGTHVAGTIAALDNPVGVVGVLPQGTVNLHIVKVFGFDPVTEECPYAYSSTLVAALNVCRQNGANVINMSLGGPTPNAFEQQQFQNAFNAGVLSVAAAGNDGNTAFSYPASYPSVISVAAVDSSLNHAAFSQVNNQVDLSGPGVDVLSTVSYSELVELLVASLPAPFPGNHLQGSTRGGVKAPPVDGGLCLTTGPWAGRIVLCERGQVSFAAKVLNVQNSGGLAAAIYNNVPGNFFGTLLPSTASIPGISLSQADGQAALAGLPARGRLQDFRLFPDNNNYLPFNGTSMATPHVAGVAALIWSRNPSWTNAQIREALEATALDLGTPGWDSTFGHGLVQALNALQWLWETYP